MAVMNITRRTAGAELFRLYDSVLADIYRQTMLYEQTKGTNLPEAIEHLKNAITKPANIKNRILEWVAEYGAPELDNCIAMVTNQVTRAEINSELTSMETYCANLKSQIDAQTMTWDQASTNLREHFENILPKISYPFPAGYTDIWGR